MHGDDLQEASLSRNSPIQLGWMQKAGKEILIQSLFPDKLPDFVFQLLATFSFIYKCICIGHLDLRKSSLPKALVPLDLLSFRLLTDCAFFAPSMGKTEGATTRPRLLELIKKSGMDLANLCRMEGECVAQPTKQFLEKIVDRYHLAGPCTLALPGIKKPPGPVMATGVKKFFPTAGEGSGKEAPRPVFTNLAEDLAPCPEFTSLADDIAPCPDVPSLAEDVAETDETYAAKLMKEMLTKVTPSSQTRFLHSFL